MPARMEPKAPADAGPGGARADRLRVATYNIAGGRLGLFRVLGTLREMEADLVGLQEVWRSPDGGAEGDQTGVISRAIGLRYLAYGAHGMAKVPEEGLALVSRFPLSEVTVVPTPPGRRVLLRAVAHTPRGRLTVLVVHLRGVGVATGARRARYISQRRVEATLAAREAREAARSGGPVVLLGDLNAGPGSETMRILTRPLTDACGTEAGKTWPSGLPLFRLDHILHSPPLRSLGCRVVLSTASDHRPVMAEISW